MASFSERVTIYIETKVDNATSGLKNLKSSIQDAEGATGKLKAAAGGLGDVVGQAAGAFLSPAGLAAGAAAVGGAAVKAVGEFEQLGLAVGKVSDGTGLTADAASRWIEVADDAGVSTESFTKSVGFMEKAIGTNKEAFTQWGVEVVKAKDGTTDVNATLLNAIQTLNGIDDPVKRNAAGLAIFGKSWKDMSELIGEGSVKLKSDLASVQDSKVFSDKDIATARDVRDGFDAIHDAVDGLFLTMGKSLAPAVADVAKRLGEVITKAEPAFKAMGDGLSSTLEELGPVITGIGNLAGALGNLQKDAAKPLDKRSALDSIKRSAIDAVNPLQSAKDHISDLLDVVQTEPDLSGSVVNLGAHLAETNRMTAQANAYLKEHKQAVENDAEVIRDHASDTAIWAAQQEIANHQAADAADLIDGMNDKLKEHAQQLKDDASALLDQSDAFATTADAQIAYNKQLDDFNDKSKDAKASADDVRDSAIAASKGHAALYESMVTSAGGVATATGKLDAQNATLLETARTARGPAKEAIIEYIATLNGISAEKATEIVANADTAQAEQDLKDVSRNRALKVTAEAETAQAQKDINSLIAQNAGRSFGITIIPGFKAPLAAGGITPQGGGTAGEAGPEFVTLPDGTTMLINGPQYVPPGTRVTSVRKTRQILAKRPRRYANGTQVPATVATGAAPLTFVYEQNAPVYGVDDLNQHLERWSRGIAAKNSAG